MKKNFFLITAILGLTFSSLYAQHLFSVSQNDLSKENVTLLKNQITRLETTALSLTKNNENKAVYSVTLSSVEDTKIIILNEQTGTHVVITPAVPSTEFQLAPFFIEELRQGALGNASHYLIMETTPDFSVKNIASVSAVQRDVFIPQYLYGPKENVKEALPKDRQIINIFKEKPRFMPVSDDFETLRYVAQLEEAMSYYVYMYKLPNGVLAIYDEHFNPSEEKNTSKVGEQLEFILSGNLNANQTTATEHALNLWGTQLSGSVPVDINVMSVQMGQYVLGGCYPQPHFLDLETYTYYHSPLWNQLVGYDATNLRDIRIEMNSLYNNSYYYGTDGNPPGNRTDWVTVMLHEVCHGLGFAPLCRRDPDNPANNGRYVYTTSGGGGAYTNYPGIFDRQLFEGLTGPCLTDLDQAGRAALLISGNLYSGTPGSNLLAANGGTRVRMFAPNPYQPGSSVSHWHSSGLGFITFMQSSIGSGPSNAIHTFNTRKIGILLDMGWTQPINNPNASWVTFMANGGTGSMSKQQFLPGEAQNLRANSFTRAGYTFANWTTEEDGTGDSYANQQSITLSNNMDLYAQWYPRLYTLTLNPNGGTVDPTAIEVVYDAPVGEMPIPVREGYTFRYWHSGPTIITEETIWNYTQDMTVTANWLLGTSHTITATATQGGTISPSGNVAVTEGTSRTFTITPNEEYIILDVLVNGESVGAVNTHTFENVVAPHTIHAIFSGLAIVEVENFQPLQIVPNPANHTIELRIANYELRTDQIEFYNAFGQLVKSVPFAGQTSKDVTTQKINISDLSAGIYVVRVGDKAAKLVVN
ncbi:MAG: InlB B-repeat-containing protein [Bacteroidetes bacterium]|nr:InlB B-repeat-containing protein [Bacteroidota bacterium]MCL2302698.1 InlB B-repeat-containing protein [Lentimicrobiaceae bacterium]